MLLIVAEMQELKADPKAAPTGTVIEANLDKGKGPVATVIVQEGTLHRGDIIHTGTAWGKIRAMIDDKGNNVNSAGPSMPRSLDWKTYRSRARSSPRSPRSARRATSSRRANLSAARRTRARRSA